jgi:hypothetical protein
MGSRTMEDTTVNNTIRVRHVGRRDDNAQQTSARLSKRVSGGMVTPLLASETGYLRGFHRCANSMLFSNSCSEKSHRVQSETSDLVPT